MPKLTARALPWISMLALCATAHPAEVPSDDSPVVATLGTRVLRLSELDAAGGRALYDAATVLNEARMRALHDWLSAEALKLEAEARGVTESQLIEQATEHLPPITEPQIDAFISTQAGSSPTDAKRRKQAQLYLGMRQQADARREYVASLLSKYHARLSLPAPGAPPAEEIRGAQSPLLGNPAAPITIVVFSDYQCPYCRELSHTIDALLARFPEQIRVIYRHYPLRPYTEQLAHASLCAADQQQFAQYHHRLFATDSKQADPTQVATSVKLDLTAFESCMSDERHVARIRADQAEGRRLGLQGTPTLFIEGQRFRGAQTLDQLASKVEKALAQLPNNPPLRGNTQERRW